MKKLSLLLGLNLLASAVSANQVDDWIRDLKSTSALTRRAAALSLGNTEPAAFEAIPALISAAGILEPWNRETREARKEVFRALAKIGPNDPRVFRLLISELGDDRNYLDRQYGADDALVAMGPGGVALVEEILPALPMGTSSNDYRVAVIFRYLSLQSCPINRYLPTVKRLIESTNMIVVDHEIILLLRNGGANEARTLIPTVRAKLERLTENKPLKSRGVVRFLESLEEGAPPEDPIKSMANLLYHLDPADRSSIPVLERARNWYGRGGNVYAKYETAIDDLIHRIVFGTPIERDDASLLAYRELQEMLDLVRSQSEVYERGLPKHIFAPLRIQIERALPADREAFFRTLCQIAPHFFKALMREIYDNAPFLLVSELRNVVPCAQSILEFDREKEGP